MSTKGKQDESAVYTLRLPREKLEKLREIAGEENRTVAGQIREMVDRLIDEREAA